MCLFSERSETIGGLLKVLKLDVLFQCAALEP